MSVRPIAIQAAGGGFDYYRCALLQASPASGIQDRIDLGRLALAHGDAAAALMILASVGLELGFAANALRWWRDTGTATGLWSVAWDAPEDDAALFCVDRAMSEMRAVASTVAASLADGSSKADPGSVMSTTSAPADGGDVTALVGEAIATFLIGEEPRPAALFQGLQRAFATWSPTDLRHQAGAPAAVLAQLVGLNQIRQRMLVALAFVQPPLGSPALLDQAARLAEGGLGPWFSALPRLVRNDEDLLAWPYATAEGTLPDAMLPAWCVVLAAAVPQWRWLGLMRQFGRFGMEAGLAAVLKRFTTLPPVDASGYEVNDLRDVCLDHRLPDLAIAAQRHVALIHHENGNEHVILCDMLALAGEEEEAATIMADRLRHDPDDRQMLERDGAARAGRLAEYVATHGFFGDADRGARRRQGMISRKATERSHVTDSVGA